ncbi:MAG: hypothetical protein ACKOC5_00475, partial [Chloroflexota bacterium]
YPLAIYLDDRETTFRREFFYDTPNRLERFLPDASAWESCLRLIDVRDYNPRGRLELVMDDEAGRSVAYVEIEKDEKSNL